MHVEPFTVLVDTGEQIPWTFEGFAGQGVKCDEVVRVRCERKYLGESHGDYSLKGHEGRIHIERKSVEDAIGTFLSHGDRRHQAWLRELDYLQSIEVAAVIIEGSLTDVCGSVIQHGKREKRTLAKTLLGQVMAWQQDYRMPWIFADDVRMAQRCALSIFRRYWKHETKRQKTISKIINQL